MVLNLTADSFKTEVLQSNIPVVVDFWAEWCGPCKMLAPIFEEASKSFPGQMKFAKISTEDYPELAEEYEIRGIPCLIVFKKGREIDRIIGLQPKEALIKKLKVHVG